MNRAIPNPVAAMNTAHASRRVAAYALSALLVAGVAVAHIRSAEAHRAPAIVRAQAASRPEAPAFTLADTAGVKHSLSDYHGHPITLFFYCGCEWCHRAATVWGQFQRGNVLPPDHTGQPASTLIVFSGDASAAGQFRDETGLDPNSTVLLPDPDMDVTLGKYNAEPCPRVFVIDPNGHIAYTNNHADDAPRKASALAIASRALDALRDCSGSSSTASPVSPRKS